MSNEINLIKKGIAYKVLKYMYENRKDRTIYASRILHEGVVEAAHSNILNVIGALIKDGMIEQIQNKENKSIKYIVLTKKGEEVVKKILEAENILVKEVKDDRLTA
jgi:DNA-binding MarR family transcriptional regulator